MSHHARSRIIVGRAAVGRAVLAAVLLAAAGLATDRSTAAFTGSTSNGANTVEAAMFACASPGSQSVIPDADVTVDENKPTENEGDGDPLVVQAEASRRSRVLLRFPLPAVPVGCSVTSATLTMQVTTFNGPLTYQVDRVVAPWSENAATWNNQPPVAGQPVNVTTATPTVEWDVTGPVQGLYANANYGLRITENDSPSGSDENKYASRKTAKDAPTLLVEWG